MSTIVLEHTIQRIQIERQAGPYRIQTGGQGPSGSNGTSGADGDITWEGPWLTATAYTANQAVENDGASYACTAGHTSGASTEPGVGASWATVWDLMAAKGDQGDPGVQGDQGDPGSNGSNGAPGADGSDPGILLNFDTATTDADPGAGDLRANNASLASATQLFVSKTSRGGSNIAAFLLALADSTNTVKGTLVVTDPASDAQATFNVTGVTDATGYVKVAVSGHSGATAFANALPISFQFSRAGNVGASGAGSGDVVGPASAVDNHVALFDGVTGKQIKDSGVVLGTAASKAVGTSAGNVPELDGGGKLDTAVLPTLAITSVFVVASQVAMLALSAQEGDVAVRTDQNKSYILSTNSPSTLADWKELLTPTDAVLSVAGLTGAISAAALKTALAIAVADITNASANGRSLISAANYAAMRGLLDLEAGTDFYSIAAANAAFQAIDAQLSSLVRQNSQSAAYTLVLTDGGKHIYHPAADTTARIWTIPANSSVAFPIGTVVTFDNDIGAGVITIAITTDTLVFVGSGSTGSRTLAAGGQATALKVTSTRWRISGVGLT